MGAAPVRWLRYHRPALRSYLEESTGVPKQRTSWICQECGTSSPAYLGRCPGCGAWHSMVETLDQPAPAARMRSTARQDGSRPVRLHEVDVSTGGRIALRIDEFNRVLGGGIVPGSVVLIGGDPGIGKSTLILQAGSDLSSRGMPVLYVSAEESAQQVRLRADRMGVDGKDLYIHAEIDLDSILAAAEQLKPGLVIIDSVQTIQSAELESTPGTVSQVRTCASRLANWAKPNNVPVFLIGHVTKEGTVAGPRVLEHMVDAVLYLEGDRFHQYRVLRAAKNRFGSTNEIGVFDMADSGLQEVRNPSEVFLEERNMMAAGSAVAVTLEGSRPILLEIQALAAQTSFGLPRRSATGFDTNRLHLLLAVLQRRVGMGLGNHDVYVNVIGGFRVNEPAADLAAAVAIASGVRDTRVPADTVYIGEVGLSGDLRTVQHIDRRVQEAVRLGFRRAVVPGRWKEAGQKAGGIEVTGMRTLRETVMDIPGMFGGRDLDAEND
ncbi:MAG TPA: DNA repair protein RadA [Thermomicrobiales bacterium]|nr:DNA repair protein RadA [Thermomicrobiales bacterium]